MRMKCVKRTRCHRLVWLLFQLFSILWLYFAVANNIDQNHNSIIEFDIIWWKKSIEIIELCWANEQKQTTFFIDAHEFDCSFPFPLIWTLRLIETDAKTDQRRSPRKKRKKKKTLDGISTINLLSCHSINWIRNGSRVYSRLCRKLGSACDWQTTEKETRSKISQVLLCVSLGHDGQVD